MNKLETESGARPGAELGVKTGAAPGAKAKLGDELGAGSGNEPRVSSTAKPKIIFLGNGPLAEAAKKVLGQDFELVFQARTHDDLEMVRRLKTENPTFPAVLASFGQIIKPDLLTLFEPEGILNIHPSLLPKYRGPSPIETAILNGDREIGVSVMKLAEKMDAGPLYFQTSFPVAALGETGAALLPLDKGKIYRALAEAGAQWIVRNLEKLPAPTPQNDQDATYTRKIVKNDAKIDPTTESAETILRKIVAFQGFPKVRFAFYGQICLILEAHIANLGGTAPSFVCADGRALVVDRLQPEGKRPMDAKSFLNGYAKKGWRD